MNGFDRQEKLRAVAVFVDQLFKTFDRTANMLANEISTLEMARYAAVRIAQLKVSEDALAEIPLHQLPNAYIGIPILNLRNSVSHALQILERITSMGPHAHDETGPAILAAVVQLVEHRDKALQFLEAMWTHTDAYDGIKSSDILARDLQAPS